MIRSISTIVFILAAASMSIAAAEPVFAAEKAEKAVYYCPMHPTYRSDKPGNCPICNMKLVPLKDGGAKAPVSHEEHVRLTGEPHVEGHAAVMLTPEKRRLIGVQTVEARKTKLARSIPAPARVAYDRELYDAQIEFLREERISRGTLRNREIAFKNLYDSRWEAPRIDVVTAKLYILGMDKPAIDALIERANADASLVYVEPEGNIWVYAEAFETDLPHVHKGDRVMLEPHALPGKTYEAAVDSVASYVDPETRRARVRIRLENDGLLRPGMYLHADIRSDLGEALAIPETAVIHAGDAKIVFVEAEDGIFEPREVVLGAKAGDLYEVKSGLKEGERVSVAGNFMLDSESRLQAAFQGAMSGGHVHGS